MAMGKMHLVRRKRKYTTRKVAPSVKTYVNKAIARNTENKYVTTYLETNFNSVSTTWTELNLCNPAQGTAEIQRVGRQIRIKSVEIRGVLAAAASELLLDESRNVMRIILLIADGGFTTPLATAGANINSALKMQLSTRAHVRRILMDRYVCLDITSTEKGGGDGYTPQQKNFSYFHKFKNPLTITYGDDTTTYPSKQLMLCAISDSSASPNPGFVAGYFLVTYEDA